MARRAKPWLRKWRGWYVQVDGKQVALGKDKTEAYRRYHTLMQRDPEAEVTTESFFAVCDDFLEWTRRHRASQTYSWYRERLQAFAVFLKDNSPRVTAAGVRPLLVQRWLDSHSN